MTSNPPPAAGAILDLGDILYAIFRHKWKILCLSALSVAGALCLPFIRPVPYESEARLYIRYVVDETAAPGGNDARIIRAEGIVNTELQILTSRNIADEVALAVGPDRILGRPKIPDAKVAAAVVVLKGLKAEIARSSSVIVLKFQHPDPEVTQAVLKSAIDCYLRMHAQFHARGAFDEFLRREVDQRHGRVVQLEEELRAAKSKLGVISLENTTESLAKQVSALQQRLVDTEGDLAQERAVLSEMLKGLSAGSSPGTNSAGTTNLVQPVPLDRVEEYKKVCALVESWARREQELLVTFTPSSSMVKYAQEQLAKYQASKHQLETNHPSLVATSVIAPTSQPGIVSQDPRLSLTTQMARVSGLESRVKVVKEQLGQLQERTAEITAAEGNINDLQRRLLLEQTNYARFAASLEQSQIDERVGKGKISNITVIQDPSVPLKSSGKLFKMMIALALGGIGGSFGLAFLIELFLDTSIKRTSDIESKLQLPLLMSIPLLDANTMRAALSGTRVPLLTAGTQQEPVSCSGGPAGGSSNLTLAPWDPRHALRPFSEALRDRLMTYFEIHQMTHKPKLVAVTSCGEGAGVSTLAAGLAASLSETGEGNVLLVDMNVQNGAAHQFRMGDLECGIDDALERGKRGPALVQENLYVVSEGPNAEHLPSVLPTRFKGLVPRLKASDFDYIIFDMPPVSQVSITPRLARFMDMTLMVVEAERTHREVIQKANAMLHNAQANVTVVLNKSRTYVPRMLKQEL